MLNKRRYSSDIAVLDMSTDSHSQHIQESRHVPRHNSLKLLSMKSR